MAASSDVPAPDVPEAGSRSETASAIRDATIGVAARAAAALAMTTDSFAFLAGNAGLYEIESSKIALDRSRREDIRELAQRMIADHTDIAGKLGSWLGGMNRPNSPPDHLDPLHQVLIDDLHGAADADFDHRYIAQQISSHEIALTLFRRYQKHGDNEGLRELAALGLPILERHMAMLRDLDARERPSAD